jgi:hypothetical protein
LNTLQNISRIFTGCNVSKKEYDRTKYARVRVEIGQMLNKKMID